MKKILIIILIVIILLMSSCASQEKMSPMIFIGRLKQNYPQINISEVFFEDDGCFCFLGDTADPTGVIKIYSDTGNSIKKICLSCNNKGKTDDIRFFSQAIAETYASEENVTEVMKYLFKNESDYHNTQWYRYASVTIDGKAYFSVENMKISTATDAELTLKPNDITFRE